MRDASPVASPRVRRGVHTAPPGNRSSPSVSRATPPPGSARHRRPDPGRARDPPPDRHRDHVEPDRRFRLAHPARRVGHPDARAGHVPEPGRISQRQARGHPTTGRSRTASSSSASGMSPSTASPRTRRLPRPISPLRHKGFPFTPVEIIPLSPKFDEQRLQPGESLKALYLFPDGLDVSQPLTVTIGPVQNTSWGDTILQLVQREQTAIRARKPPP